MFGVLDGHGADGHFVSNYISYKLVEEFEHKMKISKFRGISVPRKQVSSKRESTGGNGKERINLINTQIDTKVISSIEINNILPNLDSETESSVIEMDSGIQRKNKSLRKLNMNNVGEKVQSEMIEEALRYAFNKTHQYLAVEKFDSKLSGTTCVTT